MNAQIEPTRSEPTRSTRAEAGASARDIESALSANREALEHTLTELQQRVSAEGLTQMAMDRLRSESGMQFMRSMRDTVVHNPMPITVIALGMVWAAMSERGYGTQPQIGGHSANEGREDLTESVQESAGRIRHRASARWNEARERTRDLMGRGRERVSEAGERVGSSGMTQTRGSSTSGWEFTREHPILMAGAGVAVGAALAALLPTTRMERKRVGPVRDEAMRGGARFASEAGRGAASGVSEAELSAEGDSAETEWSAQTEQAVAGERPGGQPDRGPAGPESERRTETSEGPEDRPV